MSLNVIRVGFKQDPDSFKRLPRERLSRDNVENVRAACAACVLQLLQVAVPRAVDVHAALAPRPLRRCVGRAQMFKTKVDFLESTTGEIVWPHEWKVKCKVPPPPPPPPAARRRWVVAHTRTRAAAVLSAPTRVLLHC